MSEQKQGQPAPTSPEAQIKEAQARVKQLEAQAKTLKDEVKILEGRIANRDPGAANEVKRENELLRKRLARLQKAVNALYQESDRRGADVSGDAELLRQTVLEYCQAAQLDESLWKNIVS